MISVFFPPAGDEPFARLRQFNLLLLGLMPAALLLARGGAEVIMAVIGLSFLAVTVRRRQWYSFAEPMFAVLLVTWLLLNLVISPLALEPAVSFSRSLLWLRFIVFFAATSTWLLRSRQDLKLLLALWSATLALAMLDGFVQYATGMSLSGRAGGGSRLSGPLDRPNIGMFTARIGFPLLGIAMLLAGSRRAGAGIWLALAAYGLVAFTFIILSGERSAAVLTMASVALGAIIMILLVRRLRLYGLLLLAAVPAAFLLLYEWSESVRQRVSNFWTDIDHFWSSPYGEIFRVAFGIWRHHPLTGSGMKGFQQACRELALPGLQDACYPHAHNIYLEWLSESGLVGFIPFIAFVILLALLVLRLIWVRPDQRLTGSALCGGLIVALFPIAATQSFFSNWPAMVVWTALGTIAGVARIALREPLPDRPAGTILVIKHSALGDMILALPLFRAIRAHHPGERIVLLTTAPYVELARACGCFDAIWTDQRPKLWQPSAMLRLLRRLHSETFMRIYDLQGSQRTRFYYRLLGAPRDIWVGNAPGCRYHIPDPAEPVHIAEHRRRQLALVGIPDPGLPDLSFLQADTARFDLPARFALLVPGGSPHRPAKRWPAAAFAALAQHLAATGITPVLIGQEAERQAIEAIRTACPVAISLMGRTGFADMAALGRAAALAIGNDTGPMHIIAATGCPSLVLYSAESDPRKVSPRGDWVRLLQRPTLEDLPVAVVIAALPAPRAA